MTRVLLKLNVPMVNTGGTDPTLTEHNIPWLVRLRPDDRQAAYRLARRIFVEEGKQRVVFFRGTDRYARQGLGELADAARRLGRPIALEVRYRPEDTTYVQQIERIQQVKPDAIVMWGRPARRDARSPRCGRRAWTRPCTAPTAWSTPTSSPPPAPRPRGSP